MATVLNLEDFLDAFDLEEVEEGNSKAEKFSLWVKSGDNYSPSPDLEIKSSLPSGMYVVDYNPQQGYTCKQVNPPTDELFIFSESIAQNLLDEIKLFWSKADLYKENKLLHKRGILLEGFPGTGKSSYINMLSKDLIADGGIVFKINGIRNLSNYVDFMKYSFRKIQPNTHVITILEDIDQYRDAESDLLDFLDGQFHLDHHVVIATSNNTENIPDTFLRPSRLDLKIEVPLPSEMTRKEYFTYKNVPEEDITELVEESEGLSLADLKEIYICVYMLDYTVERAVQQINEPQEKRSYLEGRKRKTKISL